jgi:EpsI family protein
MKLFSIRHLVIGLAMLMAFGLSIAMKPTVRTADKGPKVNLEAMIPVAFGDWKIDPTVIQVQPSPDVQQNLNAIYDQVLSRTYVNSQGERIMLSIAYGGAQTDQLKAHRQEVCYSAQGFQIKYLINQAVKIGQSTIPITRMLAVQDKRSEPVTYWFTMGDSVVLTTFERLMVQLKYGLSGEIPDGMLVRVSNLSTQPERAYQAHMDFIDTLVSHVDDKTRARLLGGAPGT